MRRSKKTTTLAALKSESDAGPRIFSSRYAFGDFIIVAEENEKEKEPKYLYRMARIDVCRLNRCPIVNQSKFPKDNKCEEDVYWPLYFFHNEERRWVQQKYFGFLIPPESTQRDGFEELKNIDATFESQLFKQRCPEPEKAKDDPILREGHRVMMKTGGYRNFQFKFGDLAEKERLRKWMLWDDSIELNNDWTKNKWASEFYDTNPKGSTMVVDDLNSDNDPIQVAHEQAKTKVRDVQPEDFVYLMYREKFYLARVLRKDNFKFEVHYYSAVKQPKSETGGSPKRRKLTKDEDKPTLYRPNPRDIDWINEKRQGYVVAHLPSTWVRLDKKHNIYDFTMPVGNEETIDYFLGRKEREWDIWVRSLEIKSLSRTRVLGELEFKEERKNRAKRTCDDSEPRSAECSLNSDE